MNVLTNKLRGRSEEASCSNMARIKITLLQTFRNHRHEDSLTQELVNPIPKLNKSSAFKLGNFIDIFHVLSVTISNSMQVKEHFCKFQSLKKILLSS